MSSSILTSKTALVTPAAGDFIHIVDVSTTTDNAAGSSRKITYANLTGGATATELGYVSGTTSALQTQMDLKAPLISPTLVTPVLGVATATTINKVTITAPATASTLTIAQGSSLITSGAYAITFTATNTTGVTLPTTGTISTLAGTEAFTNKTLTTPVLASFYQDAGKTKLMTTPNTASDTLAAIAATQTLTNKRHTRRTGTVASSATPTINSDNVDMYLITAQTETITSFTTNLSGTPVQGDTLWIAITGTAARAITWGAKFEASTVALPTTTVTTARLDVGFAWNTVADRWRCVATA